MNKERLLKMAGFLEALPPHKFDFDTYVRVGRKHPAEALAAPEEHCGTTACAVGWMPAIFPDEFEWKALSLPWSTDVLPSPIGSSCVSWRYVEVEIRNFLDITTWQYDFLFVPDSSRLNADASAIEVAQHIREFVNTNGEVCNGEIL